MIICCRSKSNASKKKRGRPKKDGVSEVEPVDVSIKDENSKGNEDLNEFKNIAGALIFR